MAKLPNHLYYSPLRYPGGKGALANFIKSVLIVNNLLDGDYAEVYGGGAGIAWALLFEDYVQTVHINDLDSSVMAFWRSVLEATDDLCARIRDTAVTVDEWHRQRGIQNHPETHSPVEVAFSTFFLNRTNRSGILRGGIIGGYSQEGKWPIDARFHKADLIRRIEKVAQYSDRIRLHNRDAVEFIQQVVAGLPERALIYLDPPYYQKGQDLYQNHYRAEDHEQIAQLVRDEIRHPWIVSYDAAQPILDLYDQYPSLRYNISYSAQAHYEGTEIIFHSPNLQLPETDSPAWMRPPKVPTPPRLPLDYSA